MGKQFRFDLRLRLRGDEVFFGPGTARLMALIDETRSIFAAASQMGMSYSKAWRMIREMERALNRKIILRQAGGREGGSSSLTEEGRLLLESYNAFEREMLRQGQLLFEEKFAAFLDAGDPDPGTPRP